MGGVVLGIVGLALFFLLGWRFDGKKSDAYGSAKWANVWELFKAGLFEGRGLRVGEWTGQLGVHYDGAHAITFGSTGSGKGTTAILPNLLSYPWFFLIDPGGENTAVAAKHWRQAGVPFGCINIFGAFTQAPWSLPAHGFNPLDFLDPASPTLASDAKVLAEMLTPRTGTEAGTSAYFKDAAENAKRAFIIHIMTAEPKVRRNLATLYRYANSDAGSWKALLKAMRDNPACGGIVCEEAIALATIAYHSPAEFSGIKSTLRQDLNFLADPIVRNMLSRSDVDFSILKGLLPGQKGGVISVVLPLEYLDSHAAVFRLAIACAVLVMVRAPVAKSKVVFLLDEAGALGKLTRLPTWLATLRKYNVAIWSIWQNLGQLADLYGKGSQTLTANCELLQILGVSNDPETAEYAEKLIGKGTIKVATTNARGERSVSETSRSLLMQDELRRLKKSEQIVVIGNLQPIKLKKTPYWLRPDLAGRFHPNPYKLGAAGASGGRFASAFWGKVYYALVCLMAPHPMAACIIMLPVALLFLSLATGGR